MVVGSYKDKYIGVERPSVYDILQRVGTTEYQESAIREYEAVGIEKVKISGNEFTNYGQYSFIWEKSYMKSPGRNSLGAIANLNSTPTFLTAHLILDFSIMSIEDYRRIMRLHYGANEFIVECYDPIYNRHIKVKMYFGTEEMAKLYTIAQKRLLPDGQWEEWVDLIGVTEYKVELIGTNNDLDYVSVSYAYNAPVDENKNPIYPNGVPIPDEHEEDVYMGEEIIVGANSTFKNNPPLGWKFKNWELRDEDGNSLQSVTDGIALTINANTTLYAVWEKSEFYTLTLNYGLATPQVDVEPETSILKQIVNLKVRQGQPIGTLPKIEIPTIKIGGKDYIGYYAVGWFKHPIEQNDMQVSADTLYWLDRDSIIYAVSRNAVYSVSYETQTDAIIPTQSVPYGGTVLLPTLYREGYKFDGWYVKTSPNSSEVGNKFSGSMRPYSIVLQARWK